MANSPYFSQLQHATTQAQTVLAGMMGKSDTAAGNAIWNQTAITGVWGVPQAEQVMLVDGGYRGRTAVQFSASRDQFPTPPDNVKSRAQIVRTDLTPNLIYRIESINFHDPFKFVFNCVRVGE